MQEQCDNVGVNNAVPPAGDGQRKDRPEDQPIGSDGANCYDEDPLELERWRELTVREEAEGWLGIPGLKPPQLVDGGPEPNTDLLRQLVLRELSEEQAVEVYRMVFRYRSWMKAMGLIVSEEAKRTVDRQRSN